MTDYMWAKPENVQKLMDKYLKEQKDKLIAEFLEDLTSLFCGEKGSIKALEKFMPKSPILRVYKKWEGKAK